MDQQQQAHVYFDSAADAWQAKSVNVADEYNVIDARNSAVMSVVKSLPAARKLLDVGCGTGQLVLAAAASGLTAEGVDFSAQMIAHCEENKAMHGRAAQFRCGSFFDLAWPEADYDVISAQGFIEYVSPNQMEAFFEQCQRMLKPGGALVVGSRNRLFNVVSMNEFSVLELNQGVLPLLESEGIALLAAATQEDAFESLERLARTDPQPSRHPGTGIDVDVRYQYAPADLISRLRRYGFTPRTLFPIHFHALPLPVKSQRPALHHQLAKMLGALAPQSHHLVPFSSSFVLDARLS
jgi:ubiquinone/menaquinone biosynthesis C-methylase UbiE